MASNAKRAHLELDTPEDTSSSISDDIVDDDDDDDYTDDDEEQINVGGQHGHIQASD